MKLTNYMLLAWCCAIAVLPAHANAEPLLHAMFQDHAVLQRDQPIKVWGRATPGEALTISLAGASATARADSSGHWTATLPTMHAGGPHSLTVRTNGGASQTVDDVLIGDVWLCSGQSNMVLQVHRTLNSRAEIADSTNDSIRTLTVGQETSLAPLATFKTPVEWLKAAPATVPDFSATCFYFARELQKTVRVPMGLINSSWGGSKIEPWMSRQAIRAVGGYDADLDVLEQYESDPAAAGRRWGEMWETWWRKRPSARSGDEPWNARPGREDHGSSAQWRNAPDGLGPWEEWGVPELASFDGMVWYRTTVKLTAAQASRDAVLSLGTIDQIDQTWVNGEPVGYTSGADDQRRYKLAPGLLKAGENLIVVNALDTYGNGGMYGPAQQRALQFADGSSVPLGGWQYRIVPSDYGPAPRAPWESVAGLTVIYNAMIAPIGHYGLRGVVWYQGASNTDDPGRYRPLLAGLMADWRGKYGADLPFLVVQLANYGPAPTHPAESGWASLREAQRLAVAQDAHAGLAVTIDIGDRYDIHPANKQEVGRRLARAARHVVYGEAIAASGPVPRAVRRDGDAVVVSFGDVAQRLVAYGAKQPIGFELCAAKTGSCTYADAAIDGNRVTLTSPNASAATRVRYCWADSPVCTLYDESRLPAGPFEVSITVDGAPSPTLPRKSGGGRRRSTDAALDTSFSRVRGGRRSADAAVDTSLSRVGGGRRNADAALDTSFSRIGGGRRSADAAFGTSFSRIGGGRRSADAAFGTSFSRVGGGRRNADAAFGTSFSRVGGGRRNADAAFGTSFSRVGGGRRNADAASGASFSRVGGGRRDADAAFDFFLPHVGGRKRGADGAFDLSLPRFSGGGQGGGAAAAANVGGQEHP